MPTHPNPYRQGLSRNAANHVPLSPISLVDWAADVYPHRLATVHGAHRVTWAEQRDRAVILDAEKKARVLALAAEQKAARDARYAARKARQR